MKPTLRPNNPDLSLGRLSSDCLLSINRKPVWRMRREEEKMQKEGLNLKWMLSVAEAGKGVTDQVEECVAMRKNTISDPEREHLIWSLQY